MRERGIIPETPMRSISRADGGSRRNPIPDKFGRVGGQ
ncbi:hypothetical protein FRUB_00134 [Fimbriiglobus ruber]|uniref:Uncharacterized protein n=1 Tax=Fimbriiglobus ruber TaxID=1908690 RepID=A0A225EDC6_9BACT|nr:hypothetical protein FRUB_00134 [Fimbriiglobus ruber]